MEPIRRIETPLGPVEFRGRDTGRPVQLVVTGAGAGVGQFENNQLRFPDLDVWRAHLPGNHCPELVTISVGAFGAAFSSALRTAAPGRQVAAIGNSAGALAVLAIDPGLLSCMVLMEPPLRPSVAWPLHARPWPKETWPFISAILGVTPEGPQPRDYLHLVDHLVAPALVLVGGKLLGPRPATVDLSDPFDPASLVDAVSLARLVAHPLVTVEAFEGAGHNLMADPAKLVDAMRRGMLPLRSAATANPQ